MCRSRGCGRSRRDAPALSTPPSWRRSAAGSRGAERLLESQESRRPCTPGWPRSAATSDCWPATCTALAPGPGSDRGRFEEGPCRLPPSDGSRRPGSLILGGDVQQGLALLEEAGVATVSGELDPLSTGLVYCELVCALQGLAQYDLAEQWTEAMERWRPTNAIGSLHGRCRVHRAEILRLRGSCEEAEQRSARRVRGAAPLPAARARMAAQRAWTDPVSERGHRRGRARLPRGSRTPAGIPQPGLALVWLAQGEVTPRRRRLFATPSITRLPYHPRSCPRTPSCIARRCSKRRSRSRLPPATSIAPARPPKNSQHVCRPIPEQGAGRRRRPRPRTGAARRGRLRRRRDGSSPWPRDSGTTSGAPHEAALARTGPRPKPSGPASSQPPTDSERRAALASSSSDRGARPPCLRDRPPATSMSFVARATTGRWRSRGAPSE